MSKTDLKKLKAESPVREIFDFPELFSPMLVKEIRQGLRSASYTGLFIGMQMILFFAFAAILLASSAFNSNIGEEVSLTLFFIYGIAVCVLQPLRGMGAIHSEISHDTLDLVLLTRLSAWKIVSGKWVSLIGQSLLFTLAILPYLIVRYFLGGMNLIEELNLFYLLFVAGAGLTAITIGLSAIPTIALRFLLSVGVLCFASSGLAGLVIITISEGDFIPSALAIEPWLFLLIFSSVSSLLVAYLSWVFLDFGTSMIAPISENRATLRRILYVAMCLFGCLWFVLLKEPAPTITGSKMPYAYNAQNEKYMMVQLCMLFLFIPFFFITMTERYQITPKISYQLLQNRFYKPLRYLLYPGWGAGCVFIALCMVFHLSLLALLTDDIHSFHVFVVTTLGSLIFPAAITYTFGKNAKSQLVFYLVTFIASMLISFMTIFLSLAIDKTLVWLFFWNPGSLMLLGGDYNSYASVAAFNLGIVLIIAYTLITLRQSGVCWKHLFKQEKIALQMSETEMEAGIKTEAEKNENSNKSDSN